MRPDVIKLIARREYRAASRAVWKAFSKEAAEAASSSNKPAPVPLASASWRNPAASLWGRRAAWFITQPGTTARKIDKQARKLLREPHRIRAFFFYLLHPNHPLFTPGATYFLSRYIRPGMRVFEWGSGRSTPFFAKHEVELTSIEHDARWFQRTQRDLDRLGLTGVDLKLIEPVGGGTDLSNYINAITKYPDDYFDLVTVDGRERLACFFAAIPKVKPGGMLLLDDSQRERYGEASTKLEKLGWTAQPIRFGFNETTIWKKPIRITSSGR